MHIASMQMVGTTSLPPPGLEHPVSFLRQIFLERKNKNGAYSTRAFARDLGMSQSLLSLVLNYKRPLTVKQCSQISVLLNHSRDEAQQFLESVLFFLPQNSKGLRKLRLRRSEPTPSRFKDLTIERFKMISQWYHVAILDLSTTKNFRDDPKWIARRLGISPIEARDALERMLELGFLTLTPQGIRKSDDKVYFTIQRSEPAVRNYHQQMLDKAKEQIQLTSDTDFARRDISTITIATSEARIAEAKVRIKKFQQELAEFLTAGECEEVYQMNMQLFPLTQTLSKGDKS